MVTRTPERRLDVVLPESSIAVEAETTDRGGRVRRDWPVLVSWLLAALLAAACLYGLLVGDAYRVARDLVVSGLAFGLLWLGDIVPAIGGAAPPEGVEANGMPNPVYALDLAFAIPAVVASGVMLLRRHPAGPLVAAVVLLKIVTLGLSVEAMGAWMVTDGHPWDAPVGILFAMLIVVSVVVLARWSGRLQPPSPGWLRRSPWR